MTGPSLDNLPPEILDNIVDIIEDEDGWDEYPTDELLNMRETCRLLERACHKRFLLYFHEWVIDPEKDRELSITKAVLASHIHTAAIEKITFVYKRTDLSIWQFTPLLQEVLKILASLNRKLTLVLDPFADFEAQSYTTTPEVSNYFNMIMVLVAASKLAISSIHVRARRQDWDKRHTPRYKHDASLVRPYRTFPGIEHGAILEDIGQELDFERQQGTEAFPSVLVAKYPGLGDVSFNYLKGHLKMRNLQTFHWLEFRDWIKELSCKRLEIKRCNLNPSDLYRVLAEAKTNDCPVRHLSIVDTVVYQQSARHEIPSSPRTSINRLIQAILPWAHYLEYLRFTNIWADVDVSPDIPVFEKNAGELELKGSKLMRTRLVQLRTDYFNADAISLDEDADSQDEDVTSEDEDVSSQDMNATSQDLNATSQDPDATSRETSEDGNATSEDEFASETLADRL